MFRQQLSILYLGRFYKLAIDHDMHIGFQLSMNRRDHFRMPVSHIGHTDPANQINILLAPCIIERAAIGFHNLQGQGRRGGLSHMPQKKFTLIQFG